MTRTIYLAALLGIFAASAAQAQTPAASADWWLVYGEDGAATAQFIDLAAIERTASGATVNVLAVDRAGREKHHALTVSCADAQEAHSVPAFICGTDAYRAQNGLNIRDFPPVALARIYFETRATS